MRATLIFCQDYLLVCNNNEIFEPDFVDFNKKVAYAESLVEAGQQLSAIEHYEKIVQQYPDHLKAWKRLALYGYYSYQDFQKIYRTSFPYWTPNELETYSVGLSSEQQLFSWLNLGGGYGFANQQSIVSQNFNLKIGILVSRFSGLYLEYVKSGSEVYNAKSISLYYQHRF